MIFPKTLALGLQLLLPASDSVPILNIEQVCDGIAQQGGVTFRDPAIAQEKKNCLESEQQIREELVKQWSSFLAADKVHCVNEATMGGESSYTELLTCLEMARDVRNLQNDADTSSAPGAPAAKPLAPAAAAPPAPALQPASPALAPPALPPAAAPIPAQPGQQ